MIKWYLVLYIIGTSSSSMITIPQTYNDKQACEETAKDWDSWGSGRNHMCVKAPVNINLNVPNLGGSACTRSYINPKTGLPQLQSIPCETPTDNMIRDKGYVCQPGATTCEVVK